MIKRNILFILTLLIVSCNTNKSVIQTTKERPKPNTSAVRTITKPVIRKPIERKPDVRSAETNKPKTEILEATTRVKVTNDIVLSYIEKYKTVAKENMLKYGIPASITLSQGILESGAGTGSLCAQANNHFGIKCHKDWFGSTIKHDDDSAGECFRKYENPFDSFQDHCLFLTERPWYSGLFKLEMTDYKAWAKGLKRAGYATDPKYPEKLIGIIERYQLYKYDVGVAGKSEEPVIKKATISPKEDLYVVGKGDTLYYISKRFNLTIDEIKQKNNIFGNTLTIGQKLKIK
jgi:flagellum-specific peptidoglycan hydrolase FlgJ